MRLRIIVLLSFVLLLTSCMPKKKSSSRLKVIASVPVIYDWTRNLMDEPTNTKLFLNLIIKNGLNYHSFTPGVTEENLINSADLLIYAGGPSEAWIDEILAKTSDQKPARLVLKLSDFYPAYTSRSEDEHLLLSPVIAQICCQKISQYLALLDPENQAAYNNYYSKYSQLLSILDNSYKIQAQKMQNQTMIICDRMPFAYLFNEYGFNYLALYDSCPAPQNIQLDLQTIKFYGQKIDELASSAVYVFDGSDQKLAKKIIANSKNPKCDTLFFDSMESLTLSQLFNGKKYIDIMQNNLTLMRTN